MQNESEILDLSSIRAVQRNVDTTSENYRFSDVRKRLEMFNDYGYHAVAANQAKVRDVTREGFQKFNIKLENPELNMLLPTIGKPQLLYQGSHDGTTAEKFLAALHIFVCSNGAVSSSGEIGDIRLTHVNNDEDAFREALRQFISRIPKMVTSVEAWQNVKLDQHEQLLLAQQAIELRFDALTDSYGLPTKNFPVAAHEVLRPRRYGENPTNLWNAYNNLQENLIEKGGVRGNRNAKGRRIGIRKVGGIDANTKLNQGLWALTEKMAELKGVTIQ